MYAEVTLGVVSHIAAAFEGGGKGGEFQLAGEAGLGGEWGRMWEGAGAEDAAGEFEGGRVGVGRGGGELEEGGSGCGRSEGGFED